MNISVVGCGYLGAVHAASMASLGHTVVGIDVDADKVALLAAGRAPFFEPGFDELLTEQLGSGRLTFSTSFRDLEHAEVHFVAVGTPQRADSPAADLTFVDSAFDALAAFALPGSLIVGKSTVPLGTVARLRERLAVKAPGVDVAWNPEFLREGFAVRDTLEPDRLVYGVEGPKAARHVAILDEVYAALLARETPRLVMNFATAELVKVSANAFLATKISFVNAMAEVAEAVGGDVTLLADALGYDARIGRRFLNAGLGFGGGCLPKDIRAFAARAEELGVGSSVAFLHEVDAINQRRRARVVDLAREALGGSLAGRRIALLGLAFKPESDDVRDAPALAVARALVAEGAYVTATDPEALDTARRALPDIDYCSDPYAAFDRAELAIVATEWRAFRELDPARARAAVAGDTIIDARNCLDEAAWTAAGWVYRGLGR